MRTKFTIAALVLAAMFVSASTALAGGPGDTFCTVPNAGKGATALRGTIAVNVQDATVPVTNVDFTVRLERGGAIAFFRTSLLTQVNSRANEAILCDVFIDNGSDAARDLRAAVLNTFGFPSTAKFVITDKSVTKGEVQGGLTPQWLCNETFTAGDPNPIAPTNPCLTQPPRGASMADVIIYVQ